MAAGFPILFVAPEGLVDALFASGLIKRLWDEIPEARFTIAGGAETEVLWRDMPRLDRFVTTSDARGARLSLWSAMRARNWTLVVDTHGGSLGRMLTAKKRALYKPLPQDAGPVHRVMDYARLLKLEDEPPAPHLFTSQETEAQADSLIGPGQGPILALGPGAGWVGRTWPAERFNEVAARLLGPDGPLEGGRLMIMGDEHHRDAAHTVRFATARDRVIDLTGKTDPLLAYACLKRARLYLGNDSLWTHLAAAAEISVIGLYGPSDERLAGPWGPDTRAVRGPRQYEDFLAVDPHLNQALNHMLDLPVDVVLDAARKLVADTEPALV